MGRIKDNLGLGRVDTVTLEPSELQFLMSMNAKFQLELNRIMQQAAADFLRYVAVNRLEYSPDVDLRFNFMPEKSENNLEITVVSD